MVMKATPRMPPIPKLTEVRTVQRFAVENIYMPSANTEYPWNVPFGCKRFIITVRDGTAVRVAMEPKKVAGSDYPYFTLDTNGYWQESDLDIQTDDFFIYFACASAAKTVEIIIGM